MLTGMFGLDRLQLAEDVVQDSFIRALQTWPCDGLPANAPGWLMQTAKRLALDHIRREKTFRGKQPEIIATVEDGPEREGIPSFEEELKDGPLRLIFACCHPALPPDARTALALKTLCGLSPAEIASAFLATEAAIAKRLTRARESIREQKIPFEIPSGPQLSTRLDGVLQVVYLLFSEGYKTSAGESLIRAELCHEAIRLAAQLAAHPATDRPRTHALLALMLLNAARLPARIDAGGSLVRLEDQDRALWDRALIGLGLQHLARAATGEELGEYHLQAGIAACHCAAADYASTDWRMILAHYDQWLEMTGSPIVALNRAVALAKVEGPAVGIRTIEAICERPPLDTYYLTWAILGELETQREERGKAADHLRKALRFAELKSEQAFLSRRLREIAKR